jgi:hypothetical protein
VLVHRVANHHVTEEGAHEHRDRGARVRRLVGKSKLAQPRHVALEALGRDMGSDARRARCFRPLLGLADHLAKERARRAHLREEHGAPFGELDPGVAGLLREHGYAGGVKLFVE